MSETSSSPSRVTRVRHETHRRELEVVRVESPSPHFRRVIFGGPALAGFVSASFDDHVKLILGDVARDYTPRHYDRAANELTIEFALHGAGPAADFAASAAIGQRVVIGGPRGSFIVPTDFDWHLLIGDESAIPAMARRLEELPAGARALVIAQVQDIADRHDFVTHAKLELQWVDDAQALLAAIRSLALPPGEGYAWCAGEASAMAALRRILVEEKGHNRHALRAAAYWKRGTVAHHENLEG